MPTNTASSDDKPAPIFAVVELFGHARIAGAVSEQTFGGSTFVRVDVPAVRFEEIDYDLRTDDGYAKKVRTIPAHTRSFGPSAIYSINWCDEHAATAAAHGIKHEPINPYSAIKAMAAIEKLQPSLPAPRRPIGPDDGPDDEPY